MARVCQQAPSEQRLPESRWAPDAARATERYINAVEATKGVVMSDAELAHLRDRAARGDEDAAAQLVELAGEREDAYELRLVVESGNTDAMDELVRLAAERGDLDELRRLAAVGDQDAVDVLDELYEEDPTEDGT
jgi:hypothetical protein